MLVYLDNCVFNRPFDDQSQIRIKLETEAIFYIQSFIKQYKISLAWSYILELENDNNPYNERKEAIQQWQKIADVDINEANNILNRANSLKLLGIKTKDALHVSCAIEAKADYFITTDDLIIKRLYNIKEIHVINPLDFIDLLEEII